MDALEFEARKEELLKECEVAPQVFDRVMPRLERFMKPFVDSLVRREQIEHAHTFVGRWPWSTVRGNHGGTLRRISHSVTHRTTR